MEMKLLFHCYCLNERKIMGDKTETKEILIWLHRAKRIFNVDYVYHIVYLRIDVDFRLASMHTCGLDMHIA